MDNWDKNKVSLYLQVVSSSDTSEHSENPSLLGNTDTNNMDQHQLPQWDQCSATNNYKFICNFNVVFEDVALKHFFD